MTGARFDNLAELRSRLLGFSQKGVSRLTGIELARLAAIEGVEPPAVWELERLADLYGIDAEQLADQPIELTEGDGVETMASLDEFRDLGDTVRARVLSAARAARDLHSLRQLTETSVPEPDEPTSLRPTIPAHAASFRAGAILAHATRDTFGLAAARIPSMRDLVAAAFPWVSVLYANMTPSGPAGLTFADAVRGPTIVLNTVGKNANPAVRRFSLAHELCHVLFDRVRSEPLAILSGYLTEVGLERERRANAFAVRLLCPESVLRTLDPDRPLDSAQQLLEYGLHYAALRLYLRVEAGIEVPLIVPQGLLTGIEPELERAEAPIGVDSFPLKGAPTERRTLVAETAARAYASDLIVRDELADYLGVTPAADVESVLDHFGFPIPDAGGLAA